MKFLCSWVYPGCGYTREAAEEERLLAEADEHLKTNHPDESIERERVRAMIRAGQPIA